MATFHDRTLAPKFQAGLLRRALAQPRGLPKSGDTSPAKVALKTDDTPAPPGVVPAHDTLAAIEGEFAAFIAQPWPDHEGWLSSEPSALSLKSQGNPDASTAAQGLLADAEARAIYSRRRLGEALEHGFALIDALDLPPLALDVIDDAIAALDALEAPDEDLEPYLAGFQRVAFVPLDAENDDEYLEDNGTAEAEPDGEPSIGWPNDFRAQLDPGRNWEADYDREAVNEDGSDDGREDHGWFAGEFDVPQVMRGMMEDARRPAVLHG